VIAAPPSPFLPILQDYWRRYPVEATQAGIHDCDGQLPDLSADGLDERRVWRTRVRSQLEAATLDGELAIDRRVLLGELAGEAVLDDWQWAKRSPAYYVEQALQALDTLLARPDTRATEAERGERLRARLTAMPRLFEHARANLDGDLIPPAYVEIALVACAGAQRFLAALEGADVARQAVADFEAFLKHELQPRGSFALGPERFERLLREKHGLALSPDDLYRHGEDLAAELLGELQRVGDWRAQIELLKAEHPSRDTLLQTYADEAARARAFVEHHRLVPIPPGEQFAVRPTADFRRATMPLGHFDKTPPFAPDDNPGILYITPVHPALPERRQQELLEAHCFTAVRAICLHETFPGHHLQLWHAKLRGSAVRRQFHSTLFAEGWALYCEELMQEAGYYDTPGLGLWRLKNAMWRAVRLMVDVGLHCRGLDLEAAAQPLIELGGLEPNTARGEALRYTTSPTQPSSYVLGRDRIVELRRRAERQPGFDLYGFHDWLLGYSSISPAFIPEPTGVT
jgi:uncharacterized protein (DUF885 family)